MSHHKLDMDEYSMRFFYTPRSISGMVIALILINVMAYSIVPLDEPNIVASGS